VGGQVRHPGPGGLRPGRRAADQHEFGHPGPGQLGQRRRAAVGQGHGHAQLAEAALSSAALLGQRTGPLQRRRHGQVEPVPAVPERGHPLQRRVAVAADHHRDPAVPHRLGVDPDRFEPGELAGE
jgi:hypothetical protein